MKIQVWKARLFKSNPLVRESLTMFIVEGQAYASWKHRPIIYRRELRIPVSDELAEQVLAATRVECPFVGEMPVYKMFGGEGYTCRDKTTGEDCNTIESCSVCGYRTHYSGNPRFRAFMTGEYGDEGHPRTTYLRADQDCVAFDQADWDHDNSRLTVSNNEGFLFVWTHGTVPVEAPFVYPMPELVESSRRYQIFVL